MNNEKLGQEPAFPCEHFPQDSTVEGMSKRFYAACAAMQGMLANPNENLVHTVDNDIVRVAYRMADELLKQENI